MSEGRPLSEGDRAISAEEIAAWEKEIIELTNDVAHKKARIKFLEHKLWAVDVIRQALAKEDDAR
jgi:hypothetical protein